LSGETDPAKSRGVDLFVRCITGSNLHGGCHLQESVEGLGIVPLTFLQPTSMNGMGVPFGSFTVPEMHIWTMGDRKSELVLQKWNLEEKVC
jgi:hypothetical protein